MYLKRITINGFKSFAGKTTLHLEPGITAVVGPNGSGKSNLADAIRWALGEQSKGRLRLADREEVVFAGTASKPKASYAEVTLLFDNADSAFPLDLTEVEISRRLYRSGETDYRLAGQSARLSDIQVLLAGAGFGANTYAVIGQGMIDSLLLSPPAERKLLFDEAAGIRGPELSRESALRKLTATEANLTRLRDIAAELSPRVSSLERQMASAEQQRQLEQRAAELRASLVAAGLAHWGQAEVRASARLHATSTLAHRLAHDVARFTAELALVTEQAEAQQTEIRQLQQSLSTAEATRDQLSEEMLTCQVALAETEQARAQAAELARELDQARSEQAASRARLVELEAELASNADAHQHATKSVERTHRAVAAAQAALVAIRKSQADGTRDQYVTHALEILKNLATSLDHDQPSLDQIRLLVHKAGRLLSHAKRSDTMELLATLKTAQKQLETAMSKREVATEHLTNITITERSLEIDLAHQRQVVQRLDDQFAAAERTHASLQTIVSQHSQREADLANARAALEQASQELELQRQRLQDLVSVSDTPSYQAELASTLERTRAQLATVESERLQLLDQLEQARTALAATLSQAEEWGIEPPDPTLELAPDSDPNPSSAPVTTQIAEADDPRLLASLRDELVRTEALLSARAAAHLEQATEYQEVSARYADLTNQIADLEIARADLERIIAELDERIRQRFQTNFQALAEQFSAYFARLFTGGSASLELAEGPDGTYGIEIKASPKGKRFTSISALSGGERSLAGVALLAAILRVNPAPFVVLDEIDAALDEANSRRLAGILTELGEHSQLIVITHNRQTMTAAHVLFGVTLSEHHVSRLISLHLEDAAAMSAR